MPAPDYDVIHNPPRPSIYTRTDYIVNSDMSIPLGLAFTLEYGFATELARRTGLPLFDRRPQITQVVLAPPRIPRGPTVR